MLGLLIVNMLFFPQLLCSLTEGLGGYDLNQSWCCTAVCRTRGLMYAHFIRSWRSLGHSRHSPLSLMRGFALEPLKVLFVCTRSAAVRSARTAVEGTRWSLGCGSASTLGFLQRSLVVALPFVPWRRIYWRYVVETRGCCLAVRVFVFESNHLVSPLSQLGRCYATSINACLSVSPCHAH